MRSVRGSTAWHGDDASPQVCKAHRGTAPFRSSSSPLGSVGCSEQFPNTIAALGCAATLLTHGPSLTRSTDPLHRVWASPGGCWQHIRAPLQPQAQGQPTAQCLVRDPSLLCRFPLFMLPPFSPAAGLWGHTGCAHCAPCPTSPAHVPRPGSAGAASSANTAAAPLFEGFSIIAVYFTVLVLPAQRCFPSHSVVAEIMAQPGRDAVLLWHSPSTAELPWVGADAFGISLPQPLGATVSSELSALLSEQRGPVGPKRLPTPGAVGQSETQHRSSGCPGGAVPLAPASSVP